MRRLVAWSRASVNDVPIFSFGVEEVGGEAGGFVLEDEMALFVGRGCGDVGCYWKSDEVWDLEVDVKELGRWV